LQEKTTSAMSSAKNTEESQKPPISDTTVASARIVEEK
jgi:hypothetical protein